MKSVLTTEEYNRTKIIVEDFGKPGGTGEMLQEKLKKVAEAKDNWVNIIFYVFAEQFFLPMRQSLFCFQRSWQIPSCPWTETVTHDVTVMSEL